MIDRLVDKSKEQVRRSGYISPSPRDRDSDEEEKQPTVDYVDSMAYELKSGGKKAYRSKMTSSQQSVTSQSDYNDYDQNDAHGFNSRQSKIGKKSLLTHQKKSGVPVVAKHDIAAIMNPKQDERSRFNRFGAHSRSNSKEVDRSMEILNKQVDLASSQKSIAPAEVALDHINKFVGYKSKTLVVSLGETKGWLKKLVNEVKLIQSSIFPIRFYRYNRVTGQLSVFNKPDGTLKHEFKIQEILFVKQSSTTEQTAITFPGDYPWLFLLTTVERQFYLYAATKEERNIWVHEFANFCPEQFDSIESVEEKVQEQIDPFLANEVNTLSKHMMEQVNEQAQTPQPETMRGASNMSAQHSLDYYQNQIKQSQDKMHNVIKTRNEEQKIAEPDANIQQQSQGDYIQFWNNDVLHYVSRTLRAGGDNIEGVVVKKSRSTFARLLTRSKSQKGFTQDKMHLVRYLKIEFGLKRITLQKSKEDDTDAKQISFMHVTSVDKWYLSENQEGEGGHDGQDALCHKITVTTEERVYIFYVRTEIEQDLWLQHFQRVVDYVKNPRKDKLATSQTNFMSNQSAQTASNIDVLNQSKEYIEYRKGLYNYYLSTTLKAGGNSIEGELIKKTSSKIKKSYVMRHVLIDFVLRKVFFQDKEKKGKDGVGETKYVRFEDVKSAELASLDIWAGEADMKQLVGREKFILYTTSRDYEFFAKSEKERDIWTQYFCRIVDTNQGLGLTKNQHSKAYLNINNKNRSVTKYKPGQQLKNTTNQHGLEEYESPEMKLSANTCSGNLMKRIGNRKVYQLSNFHQRYYELDYEKALMKVADRSGAIDRQSKTIPLNSIRACVIKYDDQQAQYSSAQERDNSMKRSRSLLSKIRAGEEEMCKWNYNFEIDLTDRTMELFAPTRKDREKWVMIFKIIAEMNDKLISTKTLTPLVYRKQQQEIEDKNNAEARRLRELEEQEQSLRQQQVTAEQEEERKDQVRYQPLLYGQTSARDEPAMDETQLNEATVSHTEQWLVQNTHLMCKQQDQEIEPYVSQNVTLTIDSVEGEVYIVAPPPSNESVLDYESLDSIQCITAATLLVSNVDAIITFELTQANRTDVVYENYAFEEVQNAEISDHQLQENDLAAARDFKYCFVIEFITKGDKLVTCASVDDRKQWIRTFKLISQMNRLKIGFQRANIFVFEKVQREQLMRQSKKSGQSRNNQVQTNRETTNRGQTQNYQQQQRPNSNRNQSNRQTSDRKQNDQDQSQWYKKLEATNPVVNEENIQQTFTEYYSPTTTMTYRFIEGYMVKDSENAANPQFQIRFFRIVFDTAKFVVKVDRADKKMRSVSLRELRHVTPRTGVIARHEFDRTDTSQKRSILLKEDIMQEYEISETSTANKWQYEFCVEFESRSFNLSCRSFNEFDRWLNIFSLILKMNEVGESLESTNPFIFELKHGPLKTATVRREYAEEVQKQLQEAQNETIFSKESYREPQPTLVFEKYFDYNHGQHYYFNRKTEESVWVLPTGTDVQIVDMQDQQIRIEAESFNIDDLPSERGTGVEGPIISNPLARSSHRSDRQSQKLAQSGYNPVTKLKRTPRGTNEQIDDEKRQEVRTPMHQARKTDSLLNQIQQIDGPAESAQNIQVQNITIQGGHQKKKSNQGLIRSEYHTNVPQESAPMSGLKGVHSLPVLHAELETVSVDIGSDMTYGDPTRIRKKKKKKKKKKVRDMSHEVGHTDRFDSDYTERDLNSRSVLDIRLTSKLDDPSSFRNNEYINKTNEVKKPPMARVQSVESVVDGGFTGFSDSDDDVQKDKTVFHTPLRTAARQVKQLIIAQNEYDPPTDAQNESQQNKRKEIITINPNQAISRKNEDSVNMSFAASSKRKSKFLAKVEYSEDQNQELSDTFNGPNVQHHEERQQDFYLNQQYAAQESLLQVPSNSPPKKRRILKKVKRRIVQTTTSSQLVSGENSPRFGNESKVHDDEFDF